MAYRSSRDTESKVFSYAERYQMLESGDRVVVGVSGGADSVCLLFLLCAFRERLRLRLSVVHVHHGIRGDAGQDEAYVRELCKELGTDFRAVYEDVPARAREWGVSIEEAGRCVRYEAFRERAEELAREGKTEHTSEGALSAEDHARTGGGVKIAVAHNAGDNAETVLFHLFRGTGLRGLGGIPPVRDGIIRPLLCLERTEIEAYLKERGIAWRNDSTNESSKYARNRIRNRILPEAEQIARGSIPRMARTAEGLREVDAFLAETARAALAECEEGGKLETHIEDGESEKNRENVRNERAGARTEVNVERFLSYHRAVRARMVQELLERLSGGRDISAVHIGQMRELFETPGNREIFLPSGILARRSYDVVEVELLRRKETDGYPEENFGCADRKRSYTKCFDYDKIKLLFPYLELRTRKSGDTLTLSDGQGSFFRKTLKQYLIDRKVPRAERERIPVLAAGSRCVWLTGYRADAELEAGEETRHFAKIAVMICADGSAEWKLEEVTEEFPE